MNVFFIIPSVLVSIAIIVIYVAIKHDAIARSFARLRSDLQENALNRDSIFSSSDAPKNTEFKLHKLGYNISYKHFLLINGVIGLILATACVMFLNNPKLAVLAIVIWIVFVHKLLDMTYNKIIKEPMAEQAEMALQLLAEVYEVTKDLMGSFKQVVGSIKAPLKDEIERLIQDHNLNKDIDTCLNEFADRVDNRDIETFVRGIILSTHYGTDTYMVLRQTAEIIRERREQKEELINETRGKNITILIFQMAVPVVLVLLYAYSPVVRDILLNTARGQNLLCIIAVVMYVTWHFSKPRGVIEQF